MFSNILRQSSRGLINFTSVSSRPLGVPAFGMNPLITSSPLQSVVGLMQQRFKSRGNTYQPSTRKERENWGSWLDSGPLVVEKYLKEEEQRVDGS